MVAGVVVPGAAVDEFLLLDDVAFDENHVAVLELGEPRVVREANLAAVFVFHARIAVAEIPVASIVAIDDALEPAVVGAVAVGAVHFSLDRG